MTKNGPKTDKKVEKKEQKRAHFGPEMDRGRPGPGQGPKRPLYRPSKHAKGPKTAKRAKSASLSCK